MGSSSERGLVVQPLLPVNPVAMPASGADGAGRHHGYCCEENGGKHVVKSEFRQLQRILTIDSDVTGTAMPKATSSRKRKKDDKKTYKPKSKKTKLDEIGDELENETDSSEVPSRQETDVVDIDEVLGKNAEKNNLTAINVRSIIHHVVSDKRVLALVQNAVAATTDQEDGPLSRGDTNSTGDLGLDFAPKMTRAKCKLTAQGDPIAALASQSPIKELRKKISSRNKKIHFTELDLPESSSDEEYNPEEEEESALQTVRISGTQNLEVKKLKKERSDEDTESCVSFTSDLASPQIPDTPESHHKPDNSTDGQSSQTAHTVTRSLSKRLFQEPFKVPFPVSSTSTTIPAEEVSLEGDDLIAKRTRSQLPLLDIPIESIEATFQPPDFTADMYNTIQEEELDFDEIEWQKWLQGLINSDDTFAEDDHDDTEYNFMAEDQKEEKEEYRNDRAVRIPRKEVNELMEELLKDYNGDDEEIICPDEDTSDVVFLEAINDGYVKEDVQLFYPSQLKLLTKQLQQHTQLLTQIFVLAHEESTLSYEAGLCRDYVNELKAFSDRASNAELIKGLEDGRVQTSAFSFSGLEEAVKIVNSKAVSKKSGSPRKDKPQPKRIKRFKNLPEDFPPLSQKSIELMATSEDVFRFVELLPHHNLVPSTGDSLKQMKGLRVKFSEAEDTLLALGLREFGKQWDLIQQHLLPVKTSKQLQIRCKNLQSNRAPENIIKYYRRNNRLWDLPTKIEPSRWWQSGKRRSKERDPVEPQWFTSYRKKQKDCREIEEKIDAPEIPPSSEVSPPVRPIAPKMRGACTMAIPGVAPSGDQVAWVAITTADRSWADVTTKPLIYEAENSPCVNFTSASQRTPIESSTKDAGRTPVVTQSPSKELHVAEPVTQPDEQPKCDECVTQSEKSTVKEKKPWPSSQETMDSAAIKKTSTNELNKDNHADDSNSKSTHDSTGNKPTLATAKTKTLRDKPGLGVTAGRVSSRSHNAGHDSSGNVTSRKAAPNSQSCSAGNYILEPDPKFRDRAQAFAEAFLAKVKRELLDDPETYEEFLRTLAMSSTEQCSPVELYRRVEIVLGHYPDLVEDFVGFLEPHQAVEAGVFMTNLDFVRARTFLRKLEVHFQKSPSHFRKIINAFDAWNKGVAKDPVQLQQTIIPMLKGQQHLIEELCSFFDDLKPPVCSDDDFEEIELGSGSEPEVDDFEEVIIPCFVEPKKIKGRPAKGTQKNGGKNILGKPNTARKPAANVKGAKQQGAANKTVGNKSKKSNNSGKELAPAVKKTIEGQEAPADDPSKNLGNSIEREDTYQQKTTPESLVNSGNSAGEDGHDTQKTELSASEGPLSVAPSLQSETSNDSCRAEEFVPMATDSLNMELEEQDRRSCYSDEQDDVNTDVENSPRDDGYEEDDDDDDECEAIEYAEDITSCDVDSDVTAGEANTDVMTSDADADVTGCDSDAVALSAGVVPAKNLHRSEDGKLVLVWTREEDRELLQACQTMGAKKETFHHVATILPSKTVDEVKKRFVDLMNLFKASSGERTRESTNEESGSDEEDDDDSDAIGESEEEQSKQ